MGGGQPGQGGNSSPGTLGVLGQRLQTRTVTRKGRESGCLPTTSHLSLVDECSGGLSPLAFLSCPKGTGSGRDLGTVCAEGPQYRQKRGACPGSLSHSQGLKGYRIDLDGFQMTSDAGFIFQRFFSIAFSFQKNYSSQYSINKVNI